MKEIKELDNKYIVVKWEDVFNPDILTTEECDVLKHLLYTISESRKEKGKQDNKYVILNLDDEANIYYLISKLVSHTKRLTTPYVPIKDISVDLINAILIAGNP